MKGKLTGKEKRWIMYDVGNSAFTLLISTIMPIYFNYLAGNAGLSSVDYLAYWGYAASICTIIVAILGPVCGTLADTKGFKKPVFLTSISYRNNKLRFSWCNGPVAGISYCVRYCKGWILYKPCFL